MTTDIISSAAGLAAPQATGGILDKDAFLQILISQLRNQDPIDPLKSDQLASQLAQFSSVEQLNNINANLEGLMELDFALNQSISNTLATTFVGKHVKAVGNQVAIADGGSAALHFELPEAASTLTIEITDGAGNVVRTIQQSSLLPGDHQFEWDGKNDSGNTVADGTYEFTVTGQDVNGESFTAQTYVLGPITSIRYENGHAVLLVNGLEIFMANVMEIGVAPEATNDKEEKITAETR